ncbi:MAG: hypothetical protein SGARI_002189, partial [Bacillariaceae sp.]
MTRLRTFITDLLKSSVAFQNISNKMDEKLMTIITRKIGGLFDNLDNSIVDNSNVRFVYSFPRKTNRGGWQQLARAVWELRQQELRKRQADVENSRLVDNELCYDTDDDDDVESEEIIDTKVMEKLHLYASS